MELLLPKELYKSSGVYCIKSLIDDKIYIGSSVYLKKRYNEHKRYLLKNTHQTQHLQNFSNKYGIENLCFEVIELCPIENLITIEQKWIDLYDSKGLLFNTCKIAGNTLGYKHTEESLNKMKNRVISEETRQKQSEWQKGNSKSEELKNKWKDGRRKGKPKSEEWKKIMSEKMKGNKNAQGTIHDKEMVRKRSEQHSIKLKGRKLPESQRKKISDNSPFKGKPRSEEYKRNMSESCKRRFKKN